MAALADAAYVAGDGTGKPLGIATTGNGVTVVTAAAGSATAFKLADLVSVSKALPAAYRPRATWLMHPDELANLASLTDASAGLVLASLQNNPPALFGRPVETSADLAAPAANARSLVLADDDVLVRACGKHGHRLLELQRSGDADRLLRTADALRGVSRISANQGTDVPRGEALQNSRSEGTGRKIARRCCVQRVFVHESEPEVNQTCSVCTRSSRRS